VIRSYFAKLKIILALFTIGFGKVKLKCQALYRSLYLCKWCDNFTRLWRCKL